MADGYGFGAEGDWKTAMLVRIAAVMGAGRPGGASLMEDYTYHMVPGEELSLGAHMLEVSPSLSSQRARLDIAPLAIGGKEDPVRLVFTADPGPAVVLALSDMRDRFRLVAAEVECVPLPAADAQPPRRSRRVALEARLPHGGDGLARRRRLAPHGDEQPDQHPGRAGLRRR